MQKIKILRVIARMNVGGPAFLVKELMLGIDPSIFDHVLVYGICKGGESEISNVAGLGKTYKLKSLSRSVNPLSDLRALLALAKIIRKEKPDLIDTHTFKAGFLIRTYYLFFLKKNVKVTHHFHGHLLNGYFSATTLNIYKIIEKILARKANVLITDGDSITRDLVKNGIAPTEKFLSITPGVATPDPYPIIRGKKYRSSLDESLPVVAFVGRLAPIKRPDRYLEIVDQLSKKKVACICILHGEGELHDLIEEEILKRNLNVTLLPFENDIYQILREIDLLVVTSDNEGTPLTIMEASFAGVPCVGTDVGSMRDIVKDGVNGYLIKPEATVMVDKLAELINDLPLISELRNSAQNYAQNHFKIQDYVQAHESLYCSLINSG